MLRRMSIASPAASAPASARPTRRTDVFLQPGEFFVGDEACRVRTLLGSCVSITLWNRERRIGAMSHCLLHGRPCACDRCSDDQAGLPCNRELDSRYVNEAGVLVCKALRQRGVDPQRCEARIFGGGDMFSHLSGRSGGRSVGDRNGEAARRWLRDQGIWVVSEHLFGQVHRNLSFDLATGEVHLRENDSRWAAAGALARV